MKTNGLPHLVEYGIHFDYSPALQRFYNLSKLVITCNISNNESIHTFARLSINIV